MNNIRDQRLREEVAKGQMILKQMRREMAEYERVEKKREQEEKRKIEEEKKEIAKKLEITSSEANNEQNEKKEYYKLSFTNVRDIESKKYNIKIEKKIALKCPFIAKMADSGLKESLLLANNEIVEISIETTRQAIIDYFSWLTSYIYTILSIETLIFAEYLGDDRFEKKFYSLYSATQFWEMAHDKLASLPEKILLFYINEYLNSTFGRDYGDFDHKLSSFIRNCPGLAEYIWTNYPRQDLLRSIKVPNKRLTRLSKINFSEIAVYLRQIQINTRK